MSHEPITWADDQAAFMRAGGQTTGEWNIRQAFRYADHIAEEAREINEALAITRPSQLTTDDLAKAVDGAVDCIVVCIGFLHSLGIDPQAAWDAVHAANMRKVVDGKAYRRDDGQIGKPPGWYGPEQELERLVSKARGNAGHVWERV